MKKSTHLLIKTILFSAFCLFSLSSTVFGQSNYSINFQDQEIEISPNLLTIDFSAEDFKSKHAGNVYAWIQFNEIPNLETQTAIQTSGVELINYISNRTYLARFNTNLSKEVFVQNDVRGISPVVNGMKIESEISNGNVNPWAIDGQNALLTMIIYDGISIAEIIPQLQIAGVEILNHYQGHQVLEVSVPISEISTLGDMGFVKWVEEIPSPPEKEDSRGKSLHRSNGLDTQTPTGRNYTGAGIGVLVRDDGIVGPHIDFEGRIDNSTASGSGQTHGDGVAGILTGAGNLDPTKRGMAAGANLYVSNYGSNFLDGATTTRINNGSVQITNSSYGDGCNGGYTNNAVNVDNQIFNNPTLLHVFSCGNVSTSNCSYGAGSGWGNITGGHKQGKNVIATANLYYDGSLVNSSSRGPAYDGRIKPDIAANGQNQLSTDENNTYLSFGGTSGASPGIAGISAQLYEAYKDANAGVLPPSALIKATLLNTTNDAGNIGPDFKFGWGIVNGLRAGLLIEEGRHLTSSVSQGNSNSHSISVPTGTKQVRFMLYWMGPAAANGASAALINDLDLVVTDPSSGSYLPWILDPTPTATNLNLLATNGADHLNNMEQVLINNPVAGSYTIDVSGFAVPMGTQNYFVVYEIITDEITVTYPNRGESFVPGEQETIHWDAPASSGSFTLEYSVNNGGTWSSISTVPSLDRNYDWNVPSTITGSALVRVTRGATSDVSDSIFSIAPLVTGQAITQVCPTTITFSWNSAAGADSYDVYALGTQYMEIIGNSATSTYTHTITNPANPIWYAVVAKNSTNGWASRRTIASYYGGGLMNCAFPNDVEVVSINNSGDDFSTLCNPSGSFPEVAILNAGSASISNFPVTYQLTGQALVTETYTGTLVSGQQVNYTFATPLSISTTGNYTLTCSAILPGDGNPTNDSQVLNFYVQGAATSTPFLEDFEGAGFLPNGWSLVNPDTDLTWVEASVIGSAGTPTQAAYVNNYSYNSSGEVDYFETETFSIGGTIATMTFDLSKAQYSGTYDDSLKVGISSDCGSTWTTIYAKGGSTIATVGNVTGNFSPSSANDWRNESVDLSAYAGQSVIFRFINVTDYSNSTYVDNINITSNLSVNEYSPLNVGIYPNPTIEKFTLAIGNLKQTDFEVVIMNNVGQIVKTISPIEFQNNTTQVEISNFANGVYYIHVQAGDFTVVKKLIKK